MAADRWGDLLDPKAEECCIGRLHAYQMPNGTIPNWLGNITKTEIN